MTTTSSRMDNMSVLLLPSYIISSENKESGKGKDGADNKKEG